jgi:hypothetical protein
MPHVLITRILHVSAFAPSADCIRDLEDAHPTPPHPIHHVTKQTAPDLFQKVSLLHLQQRPSPPLCLSNLSKRPSTYISLQVQYDAIHMFLPRVEQVIKFLCFSNIYRTV